MKKLLCVFLSIALLLCLCACAPADSGNPTDTDPTESSTQTEPTEPPVKEQKLISTYNCKGMSILSSLWPEFIFTFSYNEDYSGGTVTLSGPGQETLPGEFTCDENHRVNNITITEDGDTMRIEVQYDECDRVTFAKITMEADGEETLILHSEKTYDEYGNVIYSYLHNPQYNQITINESTFNSEGRALETVQQVKMGETEVYTKTTCTYDGSALTSITISDKESVQMSFTFQPEEVDGITYYVASMDGQSIRYAFNEDGKGILTEMSVGDTVVSRNENTYNKDGKLIKSESTYTTGSTVCEYTYDEDGTLIGTTLTRDGEQTGYLYTTYITITP